MKFTLRSAPFYAIIIFQIFVCFSSCEAQAPKSSWKLDSLRLDSLIKRVPDSVKREIRESIKKELDQQKRYNSAEAAKSKVEFEANIAEALNLKLIVKDTDFKFSTLHIFNDVLFGHYRQLIKNQYYSEYFIQSLTDTSKLTEFTNYDLSNDNPPSFDCYRNGCVYFNYGTTMKSLCSDGKLTEFFTKYQEKYIVGKATNYTRKVTIYKNQAILIRSKDISAFDLVSQNLIWKYNIPPNSNIFSLLKGDTLFFAIWIGKVTDVIAYDITKQSVLWKKRFDEGLRYYSHNIYTSDYLLFQDQNNIILPASSSCYTLDMNTGNVSGKVAWISFADTTTNFVFFKVEENKLFIVDFSNGSKIIKCIDFATNKVIWDIKDAYFLGLRKQYAIAYTFGQPYYLIIDKSTGIVKDKISAPISNRPEFDLIDNYILIDQDAIYK